MVGMKSRDKEEVITGTDNSRTFGTVSAIATEAAKGMNRSQRKRRVTQKGIQQNRKHH